MSKKTNQNDNQKKKNKKYKGAILGLAIATGVLGVSTVALGVSLGANMKQSGVYSVQLENIYEKNYNELVDNVNTTDMELSKVLTTKDKKYQCKLLTDVSNLTKNMQTNISNLPIKSEKTLDSVKFINQLSGYTETLEKKLENGQSLTAEEYQTLRELSAAISEMKENLNELSANMRYGYNILMASMIGNGEMNAFSAEFDKIKTVDVNYPTMIYDGPFSDSVVDKKIVGLSGKEVSKEEAKEFVEKLFAGAKVKYVGDTTGNFETYNFEVDAHETLFVQATKIGGHILTVSGGSESKVKNLSLVEGRNTALDFVKKNGVENAKVVWSDVLNNQAYYNIAPVENGVIIYPDLIKVKIDLEQGDIIGYDSMSFYTNHKARVLPAAKEIEADIPPEFEIKSTRLVLAPLEYNREVLCYEYKCESDNDTYYFYFNATTGAQENILKVVETDDGSKLM